jgi:RNA polymerase sigma-70 factor (ECF subfamily)
MSPELLYRAELPYVWHSLRRLGVPRADLEDLAQEVFLRAFRSFASYDPTRPLRPWLFAIAYRLVGDHRALSRHRHEQVAEADAADPALGPEASLERRRAQELTLRALGAIALDRRAVFVMCELNGHTAPEAAEAQGIPLNTAYSRLRLARVEFEREVRRLLAGPTEEGGPSHGP